MEHQFSNAKVISLIVRAMGNSIMLCTVCIMMVEILRGSAYAPVQVYKGDGIKMLPEESLLPHVLYQVMFCPFCGGNLQPVLSYCGSCGRNICFLRNHQDEGMFCPESWSFYKNLWLCTV